MHTCSDHAKCCYKHSQPTLCSSPITSHCTYWHGIFQSWYHSFTNFRNNLLATLAKQIHWHLSIFSLKLCLPYWHLKPWQWLWELLDGSLIFPHKHCLLFATSCLCVSFALDSHSDLNSVQKGNLFILYFLYNSLNKGILDFMWVFKCHSKVP